MLATPLMAYFFFGDFFGWPPFCHFAQETFVICWPPLDDVLRSFSYVTRNCPGVLACLRLVFRSRVAGPNVVSIHEEGGTAGRPTGPCFLPSCDSQKTHIEKSKVTQEKRERHEPRTLSNKG